MKSIKFIKKAAVSLLAVVFLVSCSIDDDNTVVFTPETISEIAIASPGLSTLVRALQRANLVATLDGSGSFTVFAPTNAAFDAFLAANNFSSIEEVPVDLLTKVLLNHVIDGELKSTDLSTTYVNTLATYADTDLNLSMFVDTSSGVKLNGVSNVDLTAADIDATNGVIHVVDAVIGLPTVVDFALADPNFSILVQALTRSDLTTDYVGTLSTPNGTSPAPFTVFAPTDDAFVDLLAELNVASLAAIDEPTLNATLSYHAVGGANVRSGDLMDNMTVTTLGGDITANITGGATLTDANNRVSNIIAVDVQASNGVIHAINKVILPPLQ